MHLLRYISLIFILFVFASNLALAEAPRKKVATKRPYIEKKAVLVVDAKNGNILHQVNANKLRYPASLTKLMTLYITFEALEERILSPDQMLYVSKFASTRPKSNLNLSEGDEISVRDAILSLIIKSANDSAVVLAEAIAGSEEKFAREMTLKSRELGMKQTIFKNASGLPHPQQKTTAYDLARLALALKRDFPEYYHLFSRTNFNFHGINYESHNRVTITYPWADGLKTGYIHDSGFNLVTSATKGNKSLVCIVLGGETAQIRDKRMVDLLDRYLGLDSTEKKSHGVIRVAKKGENKKKEKPIKPATKTSVKPKKNSS